MGKQGRLHLAEDADLVEDGMIAVDADSGDWVGSVIPSDVRPGRWRAAVRHPTRGFEFVRVTGSREDLVGETQAGTEDFSGPEAALAAIQRHRKY